MLSAVARRLAVVLVGVVVVAGNGVSSNAWADGASDTPCSNGCSIDWNQAGVTTTVTNTQSGTSATTGGTQSTGSTSGSSSATPKPCMSNGYGSADTTVDCSNSFGWYSNNCYYKQAPTPADTQGHVGGGWYYQTCLSAHYDNTFLEVYNPGVSKVVWLPTPPPGVPVTYTSQQVALIAVSTLPLPAPTAGRAPNLANAGGASVVGAHTWYWTNSTLMKVLTPDRTTAGGAWAQIRATPTFTIDPGDGSGLITCPDAGSAPSAGINLNTTASPSGCDHVYKTSSVDAAGRTFTARYSIGWLITFMGSDTPAWTVLTTVTRSTNDTFPVNQIQTLVTH